MRWLFCGLLSFCLVPGAWAQWYGGYPRYPPYYAPYANPNVPFLYPPPVPYPPPVVQESPRIVIHQYQEEHWRPRQIRYLIAFKDNVIQWADAYWVSANILYYVTPDHQQRAVPLDLVDRTLSERLNNERDIPFYLPAQSGKVALRLLLEQQLNLVLATQDTSRGLVVRISDVLFHLNDFTLTPEAREKLAKIAGILVAYRGVCPRLEGYTDNVGSDQYNLQLSMKRAGAVRDYLISQGVPSANLTAAGFGSTNPAAPNATAAGRERNRRVEMLIPGDVIGITVTSAVE
jgi:outer membrane protein OmpA-like peptidoglycan-associated protein